LFLKLLLQFTAGLILSAAFQ